MDEHVVQAERVVAAPPATVFALIADPAEQPRWDGNDNLASAAPGQRPHAVGAVFTTTLSNGGVRENHVVELAEDRLIAWCPGDVGQPPAGHRWRWELEDLGDGTTRVTHTYDWSALSDENRVARARSTTAEMLLASIDRVAVLAEGG